MTLKELLDKHGLALIGRTFSGHDIDDHTVVGIMSDGLMCTTKFLVTPFKVTFMPERSHYKLLSKVMSSNDYVTEIGVLCPVCRNKRVEAGEPQLDVSNVWVDCYCKDCGATWVDEYRLMGYKNLVV